MAGEPDDNGTKGRWCGRCGGKLNPAHRFCTFCGGRVENAVPQPSPDSEAPPLSPEAGKVLQEFEKELEALRMRRSRSGKSSALSGREPNLAVLAASGAIIFALIIGLFLFMLKYVTQLAGAAGR